MNTKPATLVVAANFGLAVGMAVRGGDLAPFWASVAAFTIGLFIVDPIR